MKSKRKAAIRAAVQAQYDRMSKRFGESPSPDDPKLRIQPLYKKPVEFCIQLFRDGKRMSDAIYLTRLYFTDPRTPDYIPIERWDAEKFRAMIIRWIKAD